MKRHLSLILVSTVLVLCLVGAVVAGVASGSGFSPVAYRVNGKSVSQKTVNDELSQLAGSRALRKSASQNGGTLSAASGSINSTVTAGWLNQRIELDLLRAEARRRNVTVTAAMRARMRKLVDAQVKGAPKVLRDSDVDVNAYIEALGFASQSEIGTFFAQAFAKGDVTVDPRYGTWDPRRGVCPPSGCPAATSGTGG